MVDVNHAGDALTIDETVIELPDPVGEVLQTEDAVVVLMDTLAKSSYSRNVWAYELDGSLRWKIEPAEEYDGDHQPYTGISFGDGELRASNWNGMSYTIDVESGTILDGTFVG